MIEAIEPAFELWSDFLKPFVVPAVGAVAGVFLKDAFDKRRAKRQYGIVDAEFLCEQVSQVREIALDYWSSKREEDPHLAEARIMGMLHGCHEIISTTNLGNDIRRNELQDALSDFRNVCTSGTFGQADRTYDAEKLREIEIEGRALVAKVLSFRRQ